MRVTIIAAALAALAAVAGPAMAQGTPVVATQRLQDTSVRVFLGQVSPGQLRVWSTKLFELSARNQKLNVQLIGGIKSGNISREQSEALQDEMDRIFVEILATQRQLTVGCLQRPAVELVDGTLGLHVHDTVPVTRTFDRDGGTLTMFFRNTPIVDAVDPGSPAEKAGVRVGDVWISANGRQLLDTVRFDELLKPGAVVSARFLRGGKEVKVDPMQVVRKPMDASSIACARVSDFTFGAPSFLPGKPTGQAPPGFPADVMIQKRIPAPPSAGAGGQGTVSVQVFMFTPRIAQYGGAVFQPLDDDWRKSMGLEGDGLIITDLSDGSPAEAAGLRKGELIKMINDEPVSTIAAFRHAIETQRKMVFTVYNKTTGTRTVTMGRR